MELQLRCLAALDSRGVQNHLLSQDGGASRAQDRWFTLSEKFSGNLSSDVLDWVFELQLFLAASIELQSFLSIERVDFYTQTSNPELNSLFIEK